ncbi:MAG: SDR family oxidoreductase [Chitinophagales bacterium]
MKHLNGKVVWLTGASSGIGEALAIELAKENVKLVISARREDELQRVKKLLPLSEENCWVLPLDLERPETFKEKTNEVVQRFGRIDILINNAGLSQRSLAKNTSIDVDKRLMNVNYIGTVALTKQVLPFMITAQSGLFVTITSAVGKIPSPWRSSYAAAKHALHGFFDSLRAECYNDGIRVLLVCPGFIATNVSLNALTDDGTPLGKMDEATQKGLQPQQCAAEIVSAISCGKEEVVIGGLKEKFGVWMKRHFPSLFSVMIRKMAVR